MAWEQAYTTALSQREIGPGVVLLAADASGEFEYAFEMGQRGWGDKHSSAPFDRHTAMRLASCTKLLTSVATLQCVERGLLSLDADIGDVVPRLKTRQLISLDEKGELVYGEKKGPITLRQMLTHTSGLSYHFFSPAMQKWAAAMGRDMTKGETIVGHLDIPVTFEPGTSWDYGVGLDWVGQAIQAATGLDLETFLQQNVWSPLGAKMTFFPKKHPDIEATIPVCCARNQSGEVGIDGVDIFRFERTDAFGGGGCFSAPEDFVKVLQSLLKDDGKLLKPETAKMLFTPQLSAENGIAMRGLLTSNDAVYRIAGRHVKDDEGMDHGLGGMLSTDDLPGWRGRNALMWGGLPNLTWFVDRERGLCGMMAGQIVPPGDVKMTDLNELWERGIYKKYGEWKKGKQ